MDVRMPDGTIIKNVPEGTTRAQLQARLDKANQPPMGRGLPTDAINALDYGKGVPLLKEAIAGAYAPLGAAVDAAKGRGFNLGRAYDRQLARQDAIDAYDDKHFPVTSSVGRFAGGVGTSLAVPGARSLKLLPSLASSVGYGALEGFSGNREDRLGGALRGALWAGGGDLIGRGVFGGISRLARGKTPTQAQKVLMDEGITLTPGQSFGGMAQNMEGKLAGTAPLMGDAISAAYRRQTKQLNRAAINRALRPLGKQLPPGMSGTEAMKFLQGAQNEAYASARAGLRFDVDDTFRQALDGIGAKAVDNPVMSSEHVSRLRKVIASLDDRISRAGGMLGGDDLKSITSDLNKQASKMMAGANSAETQELGSYVSEIAGLLDDAARRNPASDAAAVRLMDKADEAYAMGVRVENAARSRGGEAASFSAKQLDAAIQKADKTARNRAYLRGDALMQDLGNAAAEVLPNKIPDSGTAGRALAGALLMGSPMAPGVTLPVLGTGAAGSIPYLPGADKAMQGLLFSRSPSVRKLGDLLPQFAAPAGLLSSVFAAQSSGQ